MRVTGRGDGGHGGRAVGHKGDDMWGQRGTRVIGMQTGQWDTRVMGVGTAGMQTG